MPVRTHHPTRTWHTLWLWHTCTCGRWRTCPTPQVLRLAPWPANQRRYREW